MDSSSGSGRLLPYGAALLVALGCIYGVVQYRKDHPTTAQAAHGTDSLAALSAASKRARAAASPHAKPVKAVDKPVHAARANPAEPVRAVLRRALLTDRPEDCTVIYTPRFLRQLAGQVSRDPLQRCKTNADGDADATKITIKDLKVSGDQASATVAIDQGKEAGTTYDIDLVGGGRWKLDRLVGVDLNVARFAQVQRAGAIKVGFSAAEADCAEGRIEKFGKTRLEQAIVDARQSEIFADVFQCLPDDRLREMLGKVVRKGLAKEGIPASVVDCIIGRVEAADRARLIAYIAETDSSLIAEIQSASATCNAGASQSPPAT